MQEKKVRDSFADCLKAIGIISIVIGHTSWILPIGEFPIGPFVYTYHLMIFLFVAGFCFKSENAKEPFLYIGKCIGRLLPMFFFYHALFVLLHNLLLAAHFIDGENYSFQEILVNIINGLTFTNSENMSGAFWFIPFYLVAICLFVFCHWCTLKLKKNWILCFLCVIFGIIGLYLTYNDVNLNYRIQISFLAMPIVYLGWLVKVYREKIMNLFTWWGSLICAIVLWGILQRDIGIIELSVNSIIHPALFYLVTMIGIYFVCGIAKVINKSRIKEGVAYIGRESFHIMALHFFSVKLVDVIIGNMKGDLPNIYSVYPHAYDMWLVYYVVGVCLPLLIVWGIRKGKALWEKY